MSLAPGHKQCAIRRKQRVRGMQAELQPSDLAVQGRSTICKKRIARSAVRPNLSLQSSHWTGIGPGCRECLGQSKTETLSHGRVKKRAMAVWRLEARIGASDTDGGSTAESRATRGIVLRPGASCVQAGAWCRGQTRHGWECLTTSAGRSTGLLRCLGSVCAGASRANRQRLHDAVRGLRGLHLAQVLRRLRQLMVHLHSHLQRAAAARAKLMVEWAWLGRARRCPHHLV